MGRLRAARLIGLISALSLGLVAFPASASDLPDRARDQAAENFSIVVLPDTQYSSESYPEVFEKQTSWIKNNKDKHNIKYVLHAGDIVDESDKTQQWDNAKTALNKLDGSVPYILGVGNHDMDAMPDGEDPKEVREATAFNKNFPVSDFSDLPSFGGSYPEGQNDNSYHTFSAGGTDWLTLSMKYAPTNKEIEWGNKVISDHPNHQVMVVTHAYQKGTEKDETGKQVWSELASQHENVSFVFSGHYVAAGTITENGKSGNTVYQMQADYQDKNSPDPNSFLRLMEFSPSDKTVDVRTYSPTLDKDKTDSDNKFTIDNFEFIPAGKK